MVSKPQKPVHSFYIGNLGCSIFAHKRKNKANKEFTSYSITLSKSFVTESGEKDYTTSLNREDLGNAVLLLQRAAFASYSINTEEA